MKRKERQCEHEMPGGAGNAEAVDRLLDYGIIYIGGVIDDKVGERVCANIIELNANAVGNPQAKRLMLVINSPGGYMSAMWGIVSMMSWSRLPIHTVGIGQISSAGLMIFMAGAKPERVISPTASILSHNYIATYEGSFSHAEIQAERRNHDLTYRRGVEHYCRCTGLDEQQVMQLLLRDLDTYLTPEEAVRYGIADRIGNDFNLL